MANSKHLEVRDAILAAHEPVAPGLVKRGRAWAMPKQDDKQVKVYLDTSVPERAEFKGQPDDWLTRIRVEYQARGTPTQNAEDIADEMATQGFGLVLTDPSLGGLCMDCYAVGIAWATDEADTSLGVAQIVFEAKHRTVANSIAA